ncbi:hypothetical protein [Shimia marina]|uniref:hypothetical protein n=1 Tax=Shimia marina TaxID=321267 RepID=UPI00130E1331|nr:hypothetical protein [Shimia marina]
MIPEQTSDGQSFSVSQEQAQYIGVPVQRISRVETHRVPEGQLILVVGVASTHGMHDVRLIARDGGSVESGVLTLDLMALPPSKPIIGGSDITRQLTSATVLTDQQLAGARSIRIKGVENSIDQRIR